MRKSVMITGEHHVRDVRCKRCCRRLGWFYEMAAEADQRYKEGMTVLERAFIDREEQRPALATHDALARPRPA